MIGDDAFFGAYIRATPEERKTFWQDLEKRAKEAGLGDGFYCPYIPLQVYNDKPVKKDDEQGSIS